MRALRFIQHILLILAVALNPVAPVSAHSIGAQLSDGLATSKRAMHDPEHCAVANVSAPVRGRQPTGEVHRTSQVDVRIAHQMAGEGVKPRHAAASISVQSQGGLAEHAHHSPHAPADCCHSGGCAHGCLCQVFPFAAGVHTHVIWLAAITSGSGDWRVTLPSLTLPPLLRPPIA
jgi:hypothetical protein